MYREIHLGKRRYLHYGYSLKRVALGVEIAYKAKQVSLDLLFFWISLEW